MDVIDFLPDHPIAPQGKSFEALLPDLMEGPIGTGCRQTEIDSRDLLNYRLCGKALKGGLQFPNVAIRRIDDYMKMVRH